MSTTMEIYSQGLEQPAILEGLTGKKVGRFLDIGAYNPKVFSNTRALYEMGWGGVMIEPSPEPFLSLLRDYGGDERITLVCAAVGPERALVPFHVTADATSTTDREHYYKWKDRCNFYGRYLVPTITLGDILNQFGDFQMVNIDAEGVSANIFRELMETRMRPEVICVEHDGVDLREAAPHYRRTFQNGENSVFVLL